MPNLALGTVQFGLDYGVSNQVGKVSPENANAILAKAKQLNIALLDTASAYGSSETLLGQLSSDSFEIVSKVSITNENHRTLRQTLDASLTKLKRPSIYGLLIHNPDFLTTSNGKTIAEQLTRFKESGLVKKVGLSLYHPNQVELFTICKPDIVQIPLNILDQRFLQTGLLTLFKSLGIEIHVRSAFLQGLLLMSPLHRHKYFDQFDELNKWDQYIAEHSFSRLNTCLSFLKNIKEIDHLIVGCCSEVELSQIYNAWQSAEPIPKLDLHAENDALLIPSNWSLQ